MSKFYMTKLEKVTVVDDQDDYVTSTAVAKPRYASFSAKRIFLYIGSFCLIAATVTMGIVYAMRESDGEKDANVENIMYAVAPAQITCPAERQETTVCQEVYGMQYCGEAQSLDTCHASCVKNVRNHLNVNYVCQSNDDPDKSIMAYIQDNAEHWTRDVPEPSSRYDILKRGVTWLKSRVRYSQRRYHSESTVADGKKYRTDCTGYLSMAWGIPQIGTTSWLRAMKDVGEDVSNHNKIFKSIACADLKPGDALVNTGHTVLFRRWLNHTTGHFDVWHARGTIYGTLESSMTFVDAYAPTSMEKGFRTTDSSSVYYCLRRKNIVADPEVDHPIEEDEEDDDDDNDVVIDDDDENDDDVYPGFNSACSLRPEMSERIPSNSARGASIWNAYGGYLETRASQLNVNVEDLVAVLQIESGGKGFDKNTGKPILRFENHVFKRELENQGVYDSNMFAQHFRFDSTRGWQGHMYRGGSLGQPVGDWKTFHGNQARENEVLRLAVSWNEEAAYRSASYGLPQIMGFNYAMMNQPSAKTMYELFSQSIESQIDGLFAFLQNSVKSCSGLHTNRVAAIEHLRTVPPNYVKFACNHNGSGQKEYYGSRIQEAAETFRSYTKTSVQPASGSGTSCSVKGMSGFCVDEALCQGRSEAGYCPGAANIKCCIGCDGAGSA